MPVGTKRLGLAIAALILAAVCAFLIAPFLMPAESVREAVKAEIRAVTGLDPVLRGGASVSLFPSGRVTLDDVRLSDNRTGATALTADQVVARLRFFPLLIGRIQIADISLVRPTIAVVFNRDRSSNWSGHMEALARNLQRAPSQPSSFSEIRIEDGTVILRDAAERTVDQLSHVNFELAWPSISRSFAATGGFIWHDEQVTASISFTDFVAALQGDRSGVKVRFTGAPLKVAFDGYISHRPTLKMEGTLAADAASLRDALRWTGQQAPPGGGFGRFALKAQANVVATTIGLSGAHVELDGNVGEGVLSFDGQHTLQGTLAAEGLDLTPYVSTVRLLTGGEHGWDSKPIALTGFDGVEIDLRLSAARVTIASARLGRTAVAASLRGGHFNMAIGESEAFGGVVRGTVGLAKSAAGADLKAQLQFSEVDLDQCLGELFGIRRLEGKGNLAFAIESSGGSVYELTKGLNGTAALVSRKGAIAGFNVEQLLKRIERRPLSGRGDFRIGKTPYDALTVDLKIVDGIANVEEVRMTGAAVGLGLSGSASIPARELDLRGTASLLSPAALSPAFELPFMVQGSWSDPIMLPDPQSRIERSGAAAPLLDALRNHGAPEQVRSAIERLTGVPSSRPGTSGEPTPALAGASAPTDGSPSRQTAPTSSARAPEGLQPQ
ncbi:MAG TPA: AsmA family protein [Xanthobacteraceae bacterium]|jgi:AsmA protein